MKKFLSLPPIGASFGSDQLPMGWINGQAMTGYTYRINMLWQKKINVSLMKMQFKTMLLFCSVLSLLIGCTYNCDSVYQRNEYLKGRVMKLYSNPRSSRKFLYMDVLIDNKQVKYDIFERDSLGIYRVLQAGDSIVKDSGSLIFKIIREDTAFEYDVSQDCIRIEKTLDSINNGLYKKEGKSSKLRR